MHAEPTQFDRIAGQLRAIEDAYGILAATLETRHDLDGERLTRHLRWLHGEYRPATADASNIESAVYARQTLARLADSIDQLRRNRNGHTHE